MTRLTIPNPNEPMRASWARNVVHAVREQRIIAGPGVSVSCGPNGTVVSVKASRTVIRQTGGGSSVAGRYQIGSVTVDASGDAPKVSGRFVNPYYRVGGRTYIGPDSTQTGGVPCPCIICLRITCNTGTPTATLVYFADIWRLREAENDEDVYIMPLYEFDRLGNIVCDWRNGPDAAMGEFMT